MLGSHLFRSAMRLSRNCALRTVSRRIPFFFCGIHDSVAEGAAVLLEVSDEPVASRELAVGFREVEEAIGVDVLIWAAPFELDELVPRILADVLGAIEEIGRLGGEVVLGVDKAEPVGLLLVAADEQDGAAEVGEGDAAEQALDGAEVGFLAGMGEAEHGAVGVIDGGLEALEDVADAEFAVDVGETDQEGDERAQDDQGGYRGSG